MGKVRSYRYLGVWLASSLSWSMQVKSVCQKARQQIGIIYRKFYGHSNCSTLLQLYLTYVRPHLEHAVPFWDPYQQGLINLLESVQKFGLKVCTRNWAVDYGSLLNFCNFAKAVLEVAFLYIRSFMVTLSLNLRCTSSPFLLYPLTCTNAYQYLFFSHEISLWNKLLSFLHYLDSLQSFKYNSILFQ